MFTPQPTDHPKSPAWLNYTIIALVLLVGLWALNEMAFKSPTTGSTIVEIAPRGGGARGNNIGRTTVTPPAVNINPTTQPANIRNRGGRGNVGGGMQGLNTPVTRPAPVSPAELERRNAITYNNRDGSFDVKWSDTTLNAVVGRNAVNQISFDYKTDLRMGWISKDEQLLHLAAYRATSTTNGGGLNLTPQQKEDIANLRYKPHLSDAEQTKLKQLVTAWLTGWSNVAMLTDPALVPPRDALLDYLAELGKSHMEETKNDFQHRVKTIPTILSVEQCNQILGRTEAPTSDPILPR